MSATDSIKALANRHNLTREQVREIARDLGLKLDYSTERRTWFIAESAITVRLFNNHLRTRPMTARPDHSKLSTEYILQIVEALTKIDNPDENTIAMIDSLMAELANREGGDK